MRLVAHGVAHSAPSGFVFRRFRAAAFLLCAVAAATAAAIVPATAQSVEKATVTADRKVILTLDGAVAPGGAVRLSLADLDAMPIVTIRTTTPWHDGVQEFSGVSLSHLMKHVGAAGTTLSVVALNDYKTEIPLSDLKDGWPILATRRNGAQMTVRDKGPLFVIYPFDDHPDLRNEVIYNRSAWQVKAITVR